MFYFCNNTASIYVFGSITGSNISSIWNVTITGPMGLLRSIATATTNLNIWNTSIYGSNVTNKLYWSAVKGAIESVNGPITINISNFTNSNFSMNGTNVGLLVGSIGNAIIDCYNITNNASFGYGYSNTVT
jgi:hypothetical protein